MSQIADSLVVEGNINATGSASFAGGTTSAGQEKVTLVTVIATGANVAAARTVGTTSSYIVVNASTSAEGVKLPTPSTGLRIVILPPTANGVLVYASAAGQSVGAGTTNTTGFAAPKNIISTFIAISATKWRV